MKTTFKIPIVVLLLLNFGKLTQAQIKFDESQLTPSPAVGTLGRYGNTEIRKATGGINNNLTLFTLNEGKITYAPSIEYSSNGVKVDEWGGRLGISWSDNFTAVIYRSVRSLPDERAAQRIESSPESFNDYSDADLSLAESLARSIPSGSKDGEYDLFTYSIFGESGSFIIKNNSGILLNHKDSVKIDVLTTNPYTFRITLNTGARYYFGQNGLTEVSHYDTENLCDEDRSIISSDITAWFISKIELGNDVLNFNYASASSRFIYDYNENYLFQYPYTGPGTLTNCSTDLNSHTYCIRRKIANSKYVTSVEGTNFKLKFLYSSRTDLYGEKLLTLIRLLDKNDQRISSAVFSYMTTISSSALESQIHQNLEGEGEGQSLKTRYFLKDLKVFGADSVSYQKYMFSYINPEALPHRFSFSQDLFGYYNAKRNAGFIPSEKVDAIIRSVNANPVLFPILIATGDRTPNVNTVAGILNRITYPTGGYDSVTYEMNTIPYSYDSISTSTISESLLNTTGGLYIIDQEPFSIPLAGAVHLEVRTDYWEEQVPPDGQANSWVEFQLWDTDANTPISPLIYRELLENYSTSFNLEANKNYKLRFKIHGYKTYVFYSFKFTSAITTIHKQKPYYGLRIKEILQAPLTGTPVIKSYNYNMYNKNNGRLLYSDSTSIKVLYDVNQFATLGKAKCRVSYGIEGWPHIFLNRWYFTSKNRYNYDLYQDMPYIYSSITEHVGNNKESFIASEYKLSSNEDGYAIYGNYTPQIPLSNKGWDHGLETSRYYGVYNNKIGYIDKEVNWRYSNNVLSKLNNYCAGLLYEEIDRFEHVSLVYYPIYSRWYWLSSYKETDYIRNDKGYETKIAETFYRYNPFDKLIAEEETRNSKGEQLLKIVSRPHAMVASNRDLNGVYQSMVNNFMLNPEVEVIHKLGNNQISLNRANFYTPYPGIYEPRSVETQNSNTDSLETRLIYHKYDNKGNVVSVSQKDGSNISYIWSYYQSYPIAQIKGMSYAAIENILTPSVIEAFSRTNPDKTDIDNFLAPLKEAFPDAHISTFSYKPTVGMTSMTDARGRTIYYEYDDFRRLNCVRDNDRNIVKFYCYNYKGQITECNSSLGGDPEDDGMLTLRFNNETSLTFTITLVSMNDGTEYSFSIIPGINNLVRIPVTSYSLYMPYMSGVIAGNLRFKWNCSEIAGEEWLISGGEMWLEDYWLLNDNCQFQLELFN